MKRSWLSAPYAVWMLLFTIVPLVFVVYYAFTTKAGDFTVQNFSKICTKGNLQVMADSLRLAFLCTLVCLILGYPTAHFLAGRDFTHTQTLVVLILVPMWMNFLLRTYAMMTLLENNGVINTFLTAIGLPKINLIGTETAVLIGMVYNFLPFMVLPIYTVLKKLDRRVIEAAEDLGANPLNVFAKVVVPLSIPGVVSGITMVFMPAVTTFAISRLLGNGMIYLVGDMIEDYYITFTNRQVGSALSLVMLVLVMISIGLLRRVDPKGEGGGMW